MININNLGEFLKNIDPSDMSIDNIVRWPLAYRSVIFVVVFLIATVFYCKFMLGDLSRQITASLNQERQLMDVFTEHSYQAAALQAYRDQKEDVDKQLETLVSQLPTDNEVPDLLEDITRTGLDTGLEINSVVLQNEKVNGYYIELPISITAHGDYHAFANFVGEVSGLSRIVIFGDVEINRLNKSMLSLSITAKTYRYKVPEDA